MDKCNHTHQMAARAGRRLAWECLGCGHVDITDHVLGR